jgi:hypothetical protein
LRAPARTGEYRGQKGIEGARWSDQVLFDVSRGEAAKAVTLTLDLPKQRPGGYIELILRGPSAAVIEARRQPTFDVYLETMDGKRSFVRAGESALPARRLWSEQSTGAVTAAPVYGYVMREARWRLAGGRLGDDLPRSGPGWCKGSAAAKGLLLRSRPQILRERLRCGRAGRVEQESRHSPVVENRTA